MDAVGRQCLGDGIDDVLQRHLEGLAGHLGSAYPVQGLRLEEGRLHVQHGLSLPGLGNDQGHRVVFLGRAGRRVPEGLCVGRDGIANGGR